MRLIITAFLVFLFCFTGASAVADEQDEQKTPMYRVTISVTYNAVSGDDAVRIAREAVKTHEGACDVDVRIKKGQEPGGITFSDSDYDTGGRSILLGRPATLEAR